MNLLKPFLNRFIIQTEELKKKGQILLTLHDWLMITSMACLVMITICAIYLLHRLKRKLDRQTLEIINSTEQLKVLPKEVSVQWYLTVDELKGRLKLGWRIFTFIRHQRKKRKLKKRMMS